MDNERVTQYRSWFSRFVGSHYTEEEQDQRNIRLKEDHSHRVCENALRIAEGLELIGRDIALAEIIALFHDVGRFPQYVRYRTFEDSRSVNHAVLGAKTLLEQNVLSELSTRERSLIVHAVTLHNVFALPEGLDNETLLHAKLVRDADKLDIWQVFIEYFEQDTAEWPSAIGLGLPDTREYSPEILDSLKRREMVQLTRLRTLSDFRLLQLAWIYDLNFIPSLRMVLERSVIEQLTASILQTEEISRVVSNLRNYVHERVDAATAAGNPGANAFPGACCEISER